MANDSDDQSLKKEELVRAKIARLKLELELCHGDNQVCQSLRTEIARLEYWLYERNHTPPSST